VTLGVTIRPEAAADRVATLEVERTAFGSDDELAIVEEVRDLEDSFAFVAEEADFQVAVLDREAPASSGDVRLHPAFGPPVEAPP
jgi:hypothetical protein